VKLNGDVWSLMRPIDWRTVIASCLTASSTWTWWVLHTDLWTQMLRINSKIPCWNENCLKLVEKRTESEIFIEW
jgi:hypothetical protein